MKSALILLLVAPAAALWFGPRYASKRRARPVTVDGEARDWPQIDLDDAGDMAFGFVNDEKDLYFVLIPHSREAKAQLAGSYAQEFSVFVDPKAGMKRAIGVRVTAPQKAGENYMRYVTAAGEDAAASGALELKAGVFAEHGVIEGRLPLAALGTPTPKVVTVGLETSQPDRPPQKKTADPKDPASGESWARLRLWIRVKLAK